MGKKQLPAVRLKVRAFHSIYTWNKIAWVYNPDSQYGGPDDVIHYVRHNGDFQLSDYQRFSSATGYGPAGAHADSCHLKPIWPDGKVWFEICQIGKESITTRHDFFTDTTILGYSNGGFAEATSRMDQAASAVASIGGLKVPAWTDFGTVGDWSVSLQPLVDAHGPFASSTGVLTALQLRDVFNELLLDMADRICPVEFKPSTQMPKVYQQGSQASFRSSRSDYKFEKKPDDKRKDVVVDAELIVYPMLDTSSRIVTLFTKLHDAANDSADAAAARKIREYNDNLRKYIAEKTDGGTPTAPTSQRPAETEAPELSEDMKVHSDRWWDNYSLTLAAAVSKTGNTPSQAYANYLQGGGDLSQPEWETGRGVRIANAVGDPEDSSFMDKLGEGLGWIGDKAEKAGSWLGDSTMDLLKAWGPQGVVGAYAGIKATNAATSDINRTLLIGGAIVAAIFLLK